MFCVNCGNQIPKGALFCKFCGEKVERLEETAEEITSVDKRAENVAVGGSGDIKLCPDGKYRWYYEYPMMKTPVVLFTIWKVMLIAALVPALVVLLSELSDGFIQAAKQFLLVYAIAFGAVVVLSCIGYFIIAATYGFKYIVLFEMDDKGVTHVQQDKQYKKAQAISWLTVLAGVVKDSPGVMGTGILAGTKQKITSEFKNVSTVIGLKRWNTIKVNQLFAKNQVYVKSEDYDFVWDFITSHCKKAKKYMHPGKRQL